jgi:drug/metabolite transporter (DMT)-like permease
VDLAFACLGALGYGIASVLEAIGARSSQGTFQTLAAPAYLIGIGLDLLAWLASLVALRGLPVYEVQAVLAGSLAVTILTAWLVLGHRLRRIDLAAIAVTIVALAALASSSGPQKSVHLSSVAQWSLLAAVVPVAAMGAAAARASRSGAAGAGAAGALAGLAFGGAAVCARALTIPANPLAHLGHTLTTVASDPVTWALVGFGLCGMLLYANALEHGDVGPVTALLWIMEVVAPAGVGVVLLHDRVRAGWAPVAVVAVVAAVIASAVLAVAPAQPATSEPEESLRPGPS